MKKHTKTYGDRVKAERLRLSLSQAQVCAAISLSKPTQIAYENGGAIPLEYIDRIEQLGFDRIFITTSQTACEFAKNHLDWDLLGQILGEISAWESAHRRRIPDDKRGSVARLLYQHFLVEAGVEPNYLNRLMELVAYEHPEKPHGASQPAANGPPEQ